MPIDLNTDMDEKKKNRPRVILLERKGKLVGLVTVKDVLKYIAHMENSEGLNDTSRELSAIVDSAMSWFNRSSRRFNNYTQLRTQTPSEEAHELTGHA